MIEGWGWATFFFVVPFIELVGLLKPTKAEDGQSIVVIKLATVVLLPVPCAMLYASLKLLGLL